MTITLDYHWQLKHSERKIKIMLFGCNRESGDNLNILMKVFWCRNAERPSFSSFFYCNVIFRVHWLELFHKLLFVYRKTWIKGLYVKFSFKLLQEKSSENRLEDPSYESWARSLVLQMILISMYEEGWIYRYFNSSYF